VPAVEALLPRFRAAHTQVLGVSVDSVYCHANWARDLGGVSFPLLADFEPKGAVAERYGLYLAEPGIDDRATVIIDSSGIVRHASSVTPSGKRNIEELAALCEQIDREHGAGLEALPDPSGLAGDARLFVKSSCGFSRAVLIARDNLHLQEALPVSNVSEESGALDELVKLAGKDQAPCLVAGGKVIQESADIVAHLVGASTDLPG
jgi:hypothetical protein